MNNLFTKEDFIKVTELVGLDITKDACCFVVSRKQWNIKGTGSPFAWGFKADEIVHGVVYSLTSLFGIPFDIDGVSDDNFILVKNISEDIATGRMWVCERQTYGSFKVIIGSVPDYIESDIKYFQEKLCSSMGISKVYLTPEYKTKENLDIASKDSKNVPSENANPFKPGDRVKILRKPDPSEEIERYGKVLWVSGMDKCVGRIGPVSRVDDIHVQVGRHGYYFPSFVLEKVEKCEQPKDTEKEKTIVNRWFEYTYSGVFELPGDKEKGIDCLVFEIPEPSQDYGWVLVKKYIHKWGQDLYVQRATIKDNSVCLYNCESRIFCNELQFIHNEGFAIAAEYHLRAYRERAKCLMWARWKREIPTPENESKRVSCEYEGVWPDRHPERVLLEKHD